MIAAMESSSSSASKTAKLYNPSIASISSSRQLLPKDPKPKAKHATPPPSSAPLFSRDTHTKLLSDIGTSPIAEYDREVLERGEIQTIPQKAFMDWDSINPTPERLGKV
jgi:hypothetical protein